LIPLVWGLKTAQNLDRVLQQSSGDSAGSGSSGSSTSTGGGGGGGGGGNPVSFFGFPEADHELDPRMVSTTTTTVE